MPAIHPRADRFRRAGPWPASEAFTMIELLVVIVIIALLAALIMPAAGAVRIAAKTLQCGSNLVQVYTAYAAYAGDNHNALPRCPQDSQPEVHGYTPWDIVVGQAAYLADHPCQETAYSTHVPRVFVCPEAFDKVPRQAESYRCYQWPTYYPNADAWLGWARFNLPQTANFALSGWPGQAVPASALPMLVENAPDRPNAVDTGGYNGSWTTLAIAPNGGSLFFWPHHGKGNILYFDGHIGSFQPNQGYLLNTGDL